MAISATGTDKYVIIILFFSNFFQVWKTSLKLYSLVLQHHNKQTLNLKVIMFSFNSNFLDVQYNVSVQLLKYNLKAVVTSNFANSPL